MKEKRAPGRIVITDEMRANPFPIDADVFMKALAEAYSKHAGQTWVPTKKSSDPLPSDTHVEKAPS